MKRHLKLLFASLSLALPLTFNACSEEEEAVITILAPVAGASYKLTDTVMIIAKSDYSKFASGINIQYSIDQGKIWTLLRSQVRKEGIAKDTLKWCFQDEMPGFIPAGTKVGFKVLDYDKKFFAISPFIPFN